MFKLARYKIVRKYRSHSGEPVYVIKERWLCFWYQCYTTEFKTLVSAKLRLASLVAHRNRMSELKARRDIERRYDEDGTLL